jgi:hypothetical protein
MNNLVVDNFLESFRTKFATLVFSFYPEDPDVAVMVFYEKMQQAHVGMVNGLFSRQKIKRFYYDQFAALLEMTNPIKDRYLFTFPEYINNVTGIVECEVRLRIEDFDQTD